MNISTKKHKYILWDGSKLYFKNSHEEEEMIVLGAINTRKGKLTRAQKLKAVQFTNEWIVI